jgi:hypothetical protein
MRSDKNKQQQQQQQKQGFALVGLRPPHPGRTFYPTRARAYGSELN